jgi:hypothetical protein
MTAFVAAVDLLFTDPNIGREAIYTSDGGAPMLVRVVSRQADAISDFGDARLAMFIGGMIVVCTPFTCRHALTPSPRWEIGGRVRALPTGR